MNFVEISSENVRALLQARGWSLRRLAEEAGLYGESDVVDMMKDFRKKRAEEK